jgi:hypothetical protein
MPGHSPFGLSPFILAVGATLGTLAPNLPPPSALGPGALAAIACAALPRERDRKAATPLEPRERSAWWAEMQNPAIVSDAQWRAELRLPRDVFDFVVRSIARDATFRVPSNVGARAVPVAKQLACFLLRVGNALGVTTAAKNLAISKSTAVECTRRVSRAIFRCLGERITMGSNGSRLKALVKAQFTKRKFHGGVGIVDCTHTRVVVPAHIVRAAQASVFVDRQGLMTLSYQCVTDCARTPRFLDISGGVPGSAYDTKVLEKSALYKTLDNFLEEGEYLMGDVGYKLRPWMMTGWKKVDLRSVEKWRRERYQKFNKFFSGTRISVERGFGILKARFKTLGGKMDFRGLKAIDEYHHAFAACCTLHNVCADMGAVSARERVRAQSAHTRVPPRARTRDFLTMRAHSALHATAPPPRRGD